MAGSPRGRLGIVAYAFEPRRRAALGRALRSLASVGPWPSESRLVIVRRAGQPVFGDAGLGLPTLEVEDDGQRWEFGAWQHGIDESLRSGEAPDAWLLLNDTAGVNDPWPHPERVALRQAADAMAQGDRALLAGSVSAAPAGSALAGRSLTAWVQTHAFALSSAAFAAMGGRLFDADLFAAPRVQEGRLELPTAVSPPLAQHIDNWLMRRDKNGWRRHSGRADVPDALLRNKAGSILLEKRLASLVLAAGGALSDCRRPPAGALQHMARRMFYWQRRLGQALHFGRLA